MLDTCRLIPTHLSKGICRGSCSPLAEIGREVCNFRRYRSLRADVNKKWQVIRAPLNCLPLGKVRKSGSMST